MEAIPRMLMLSVELKESAERVEFGHEIKQHISQHYMEDAAKYNEQIRQLDQFRTNACNVTRDFNGISTLKKYYGQLHLLSSRFPADLFTFSWIDTFDEEPYTHTDILFEQSCILFNLGTLHSILGAIESRASEEEMKVACTHFQCAAGAFTYLKDNFQCDMSPDISFELMNMYINTMLGQAQECLLEKSMQDNRKSSLVARISMQVVEYYRQALKGLEDSNISSLMGSRRNKWWKKTLQIKAHHFTSIAYMFMSNQAEEQQKFGERLAYLTYAQTKHNEAVKMSKGQPESITEALNFAKDVVIGKFQSAKKDNEFVYHDSVPSFESLPEIKGASLVKALTFQPYDEAVAGHDIFRKLVPMEAHEASSLYSEEKAKLLRRVVDNIEDKNKKLDQYLAAVQLEQLKLPGSDPEVLPQVLLEVCAALSVKTEPIKTLVSSMKELSGVVMDVDSSLKEIEQLIEQDGKQETESQLEFGTKSAKSLEEMKKDLTKCKELHATASQSNTELHKAMQTHMENIKLLASPVETLQATLPSAKGARNEDDDEAERKMQKLVTKVDEMKTQRQTLEQQLRDHIRDDDVTGGIVTRTKGSMQEFFQNELKKHETLITYLEQNLSAQDNILKAMTEANASYAERRKMVTNIGSKREEKIGELISSYTVYDDLIEKSNKGIGFYKKLEGTVTKLLNKTKGVAKANHEERQEKTRKKYPPQRPAAPKPVSSVAGYPVLGVAGQGLQIGPTGLVIAGPLGPPEPVPVSSAPKGPKLSDYWKPKAGRTAQPPAAQPPPTQPHVFPGMPVSAAPAVSMQGPSQGPYSQARMPGGGMHQAPVALPGAQPLPGSGAVLPPVAPQVSMAQPRAPGQYVSQGGQGTRPVAAVPPSNAGQPIPAGHHQQGFPPSSRAMPQEVQMPPQNISQGPHASPVHQSRVPQHPATSMTRQDSFSSNSSQSPVHVPQQVPGGAQVQPGQAVQASQMPLSGQPGAVHANPPIPGQNYNQHQVGPNQVGMPAGVQQSPHPAQSMAHHPAAFPSHQIASSGQQIPSSIPSHSQQQPIAPQSLNNQPPVQPPAYGSEQHAIAKAASMGMSTASMQPGVPPQGTPPSSYSSAHLPSATNTTPSHMPGNSVPNQLPNQQQYIAPGNIPLAHGGQPIQNTAVQPGASVVNNTQIGNIQMPSQVGMPQHQPNLPHGQQGGNLQQQQQPPNSGVRTVVPNIQAVQPSAGTGSFPQQQGNSQMIRPQQQQYPEQQSYQSLKSQPQPQQTSMQQTYPQIGNKVQPSQQYQTPPAAPHQQPQHLQQQQQHPQQGFVSQQPQVQPGHQVPTPHQQNVPAQQQQPNIQPGNQVPTSHQQNVPAQQQQPNIQPGNQVPSSQQNLQMQQPQAYHQGYNKSPQQQINLPLQQPQGYQQTPGGTPYQSSPSKQCVPSGQPQGGMPPIAGNSTGQQVPSSIPQQVTVRPGSYQQIPQQSHQQPQQNLQQPGVQQQQINHQQYPAQGQQYPAQQQQHPPQQQQRPTQHHQHPAHQQQPAHQQHPPKQQQQPVPQQKHPQPQQFSAQQQQQHLSQQQQQHLPQQQQQHPPQQQQQHPPQQQQHPPHQPQYPPQQQQHPPQQPQYPPQQQQQQQQQTFPQQQPMPQYQQSQQHMQQPPPPAPNSNIVSQSNIRPQFQQNPPQMQQPLRPISSVQQITQKQSFEQQRLPQPVLQPMKASAKPATDLLSTSPDRQNQPLNDVLAPHSVAAKAEVQPEATQPAADPNSNVSVLASIEVQPNSIPQSQQLPSQISNSSHATVPSTSSTTDMLAALKLQPALSSPPIIAATRPSTTSNLQQPPQRTPSKPQESSAATQSTTLATLPGDKNSYVDKESLEKFVEEVERLDMYVEGLNRKMLSGPTVIERLWKELTNYQDRETRQFSIAIARCYSVKNRHPDIMPYDHNRVCLRGTRDDYINASFIKDVVPTSPCFIATQAPLQPSLNDFWLMVYEQQASIIVMLLSKPATGKGSTNFVSYWPEDKGAAQKFGDISVSLQSKRTTDYHVERIIHLTHLPTRQMRTITHLQFTAWPEFGVPSSPGVLLQFIDEVQSYHSQQRKTQIPIVVHCSAGIDRTGVFCLVYTAAREINEGHGIADIPQVVKKLRLQRRWMISEKEQLKFSYDAILCYARHALAKRGVATKSVAAASPLDAKLAPSRLNSFDVIMGTDNVDTLISRISKFSVKPNQPPATDTVKEEVVPSECAEVENVAPSQSNDGDSVFQQETVGDKVNGDMVFQGITGDSLQDPASNSTQGLLSDTGSSTPSGISSFTSSPAHSNQKPQSLDQLQVNNLEVFSQTLQNFVAPDVVESSTKQDKADNTSEGSGSMEGPSSSLPSLLADLTPQNFSMKEKGQTKQKVSKADFLDGKGGLKDSVDKVDPDDPFSGLDPMWTLKNKSSEPIQQ
ncbi:tyrosine-protein phosphatase non-receptor type 23 [Strongylocentrotus purpuratus]|uniref:Tyrosine-protein phosphatase non-receptor type 23 n=1 Tax=Strongylocentrotus purpuratus TaxID=7668 RepID=A0A7M7N0R2_STRPU|nr:tyrosine-protein phosphatase non-receptor type 23 [Strongylocentrotus purpuratus]